VPLGFAGRSLLIIAHERSGEPEQAIDLYLELGRSARYPFQQREAQANAARILADLGRLEEAIEIYARIAAEAETVDPSEAGLYRLRLGELRGRLVAPRG
jgi:tetratricopeptide (TPR) repeat protein